MALKAWAPQKGPQEVLLKCPYPEIFYGGARGGGKTDGTLGKLGKKAERYSGFNAVFFRKELPMLDDVIERSHEIYPLIGGRWLEQKKTWRFPAGGRLRFRPLERISDAEKYQGQNITDAVVEEIGNYADPKPIDRLNGVLRSVSGTPTQLVMTGNPGGPGQTWIKARYIDPAPSGMRILTRRLPNGKDHKFIFIPSLVENNILLMQKDPEYINRLYLVGNDQLVRAWLKGDWNAIEGAYFDCWSDQIVLDPFSIPDHWMRFRSFDWGSAKPFSVGWWAVVQENYIHHGYVIPKGAIVRYREWYGASEANVGLKLTAEKVGQGIKARETEKVAYGVADPAIFAEDGGPSIAERLKVSFRPADNKRVARRGAIGGWDMMRHRMEGIDGKPMIYCFSTCSDSIRTIPTLQHDSSRAEDMDTDGEDHAADEWRYACMSRPWLKPEPKRAETVVDPWGRKFKERSTWKTV